MKMRRRARGTRRMIEFISDTALSTNFQHPLDTTFSLTPGRVSSDVRSQMYS